MTALIFVGLPVILVALSAPIFIVLLAATIFGILDLNVGPIRAIHTTMFGGLDSFPLLAIPLFILAGDFMARGGIAARLIEFILSLVGGIRGSMGVAAIGSASAFGAMSGSSIACVAAIGKLTIPTLERQGYGRRFSVSLITATGVIDVIIPPSIPMILYAITAQVSITQLFFSGIIPGLMIAALLSMYVMVRAKILDIPVTGRPQLSVIIPAARRASWALFTPVLIIGGIYGGIFTPTEAAGIACIYSLLVSVYVYHELTWAGVWRCLTESTVLVAQIMILVAVAGAYGWLITTSGLPQQLVEFINGLHLDTWVLLLTFNVALLFIGSVLEPPPAILILTPLLAPVIANAGIDPVHFGLIVTINLAIGMFLPPFGLNLFASNALFKVPMSQLYIGVIPFVLIYLLVLLLITFIPSLTMVPLEWYRAG
ncbi:MULTISPECIES: TRAP transporter large permease [unclassified Xanthobacter]|uniref:TRAP transporter large permease n=1 Tax=unclassified Xanthobacter TaxID=2623496 RepID=UPI001EDFC04E|nr:MULTISPECIES: TRAP transporter large permease [unclassified Xanthobacter]